MVNFAILRDVEVWKLKPSSRAIRYNAGRFYLLVDGPDEVVRAPLHWARLCPMRYALCASLGIGMRWPIHPGSVPYTSIAPPLLSIVAADAGRSGSMMMSNAEQLHCSFLGGDRRCAPLPTRP